jgi:hypothetical protein
MELTNRLVATIATLAMAALLFVVPSARATESDPGKIQERFEAPALVRDAALTGQQLVDHAARARRQDRLAVNTGDCRTATWPEIPLRCLFTADNFDRAPRNVRMITVETRVGANTSVLTRVPADIAAR